MYLNNNTYSGQQGIFLAFELYYSNWWYLASYTCIVYIIFIGYDDGNAHNDFQAKNGFAGSNPQAQNKSNSNSG